MSEPARKSSGSNPQQLCSDCQTAMAAVKCCDELVCLLHAYCTRHAQHPSMWKIIDRKEYDKSLKEVTAMRDSVIAEIEAELSAAERAEQQLKSANIVKGTVAVKATEPALVKQAAKPTLPAFDVIRKHALKAQFFDMVDADASPSDSAAGSGELDDFKRGPEVSFNYAGFNDSDEAISAAIPAVTTTIPGEPEKPRDAAQSISNVDRFDAAFGEGRQADVRKLLFRGLEEGVAADLKAAAAETLAGSPQTLDLSRLKAQEMQQLKAKPEMILAISHATEGALRDAYPRLDAGYRDKARSLYYSLRNPRNTDLRARLLGGDLSYSALVALSDYDLQPTADKEARTRAILSSIPAADAGLWQDSGRPCARCRSTDTKYYPLAAMRDIRKAEIWGSSTAADTLYRFHCEQCGNTWESEVT